VVCIKIQSKANKCQRKSRNFTKIDEHMCQIMVRKHAKFHGNLTIGGALIVKTVSSY